MKGKYARETEFAKHLAEGKTIPQIRELMGLTKGTAQGIMLSIRRQLGPQAV